MITKNRTLAKELTTSNLVIYTTPIRYSSEITSIVVSNRSSATVTFSLDWYDSVSSTYYSVASQVPMYGQSIIQLTNAFTLQQNDVIRGLASAASAITVSIKAEEAYSVVT
jgi:hypothetical protein